MAVGNKIKLSNEDQAVIATLVSNAEEHTGLQLLVYVGNGRRDSREKVATLLARMGIKEQPALIIGLLARHGQVEIVTQDAAKERVSDEACAAAIDAMRPLLQAARWTDAISAALDVISAAAGAGTQTGSKLPNFLE